MMLKPASTQQRLAMEATGLYDQWLSSLKLISQITDPTTRKAFSEDLYKLQEQARTLLSSQLLTGVVRSKLEILLSRPVDQWVLTLPPSR